MGFRVRVFRVLGIGLGFRIWGLGFSAGVVRALKGSQIPNPFHSTRAHTHTHTHTETPTN